MKASDSFSIKRKAIIEHMRTGTLCTSDIAFLLGAQRLLNGIEKGFIMAFGKLDTPSMKATFSAE